MDKPNNVTEELVKSLQNMSLEPAFEIVAKKLKITETELEQQIAFLENLEIAKRNKTSFKSTIQKLQPNFGRVIQAGGIQLYLDKIKEHSDTDNEIKKNQLKELRWKINDMQTKQEEFWKSGIDRDKRQKWQFWLTLIISVIALLISFCNFIKK